MADLKLRLAQAMHRKPWHHQPKHIQTLYLDTADRMITQFDIRQIGQSIIVNAPRR